MSDSSARDLAATVREGLDDGCAYSCGCDRPGNPAACIHIDRYAALAALEKQAADAQADRGRLALEAATADQDWKRAEARAVRAEEALRQIAKRGCERFVDPHTCDEEPSWSFDAEYGADQVCMPCHARRALAAAEADTEPDA